MISARDVLSMTPALHSLPEPLLDALTFAFVEEDVRDGDSIGVRRGDSTCFVLLSGTLQTEAGETLFPGSLTTIERATGAETYVANDQARMARLPSAACAMLLGTRSDLSNAVRRLFQANTAAPQSSSAIRRPSSVDRRPSTVNRRPLAAGRWPLARERRQSVRQ